MRDKSLNGNMILNSIRTLMSILFPLVTFPYVSKILQVDNIGIYNFSNSVISYFILIAGLGIFSYTIREGATLRGNADKFSQFANEMFTINILSTVVAYLLLLATIFLVPKLESYTLILLLLSLQIVFKTIGMEWIYSIYEDFKYITIRSIAFQIISLILLFIFVKEESDYVKYAAITVFASVGSNILNFANAQRYCKVRITFHIEWKKHIKPILLIFSTSLAATIYVSSDITILGFLSGNYNVGLYSVSTKIYEIVKTLLGSILIVSLPRLSSYYGRNELYLFRKTTTGILNILITLLLPAVVGLFLLSKEIVLLISDSNYIEAASSLQLLSIALPFCMFAFFWGQCILLPLKKEKTLFIATVVSAIINILLNFVMIPIWQQNAAAFSTIISEVIAMIMCMVVGRNYIMLSGTIRTFVAATIGCFFIVIIVSILRVFNLSNSLFLSVSIGSSVVVYLIVQVLLKNTAIFPFIIGIKKKIKFRE